MESARYDLEFREGQPVLGALRPAMSPHAKITTHTFRGQVWYVAQDPVTLQYFRFGPTEHRVVKLLDGKHTLREIHTELQREMGAEAPSFQDLVAFVQMLRSANLLQSPEGEKLEALFERMKKKRSQRRKQMLSNFLFPQIPLCDPDRFLARTLPYVRFLFTRWFLAVWAAVVLVGIGTFFYHIRDLARPAEGVLAPENLFLLWATFVVLKAIHEFTHAFLAKHFGSEVHRMGILFLVLVTPCAFVDVTGLWGVEGKHRRALVAAAGMMSELFIAIFALFVWLGTEPGTLHSLAYNVIFIASVSSVLFNGNPLLRYDAYYILMDWLELPNLWINSRRYILYLGKRYLLGLKEEEPPVTQPREKLWMVVYGVASLCYRTVIVVGIVLFISTRFFGLGVFLGAAAAVLWLLVPLGKLVHYLLFAKATRGHRFRCATVFVVLAAAIITPLVRLPVARYIYAPCALEAQERAVVRARWRGFVQKVYVKDGQWVERGEPIVECVNRELDYDVVRTEKELEIARVRLAGYEQANQVAAAQAERVRIQELTETLAVLKQRVRDLKLTAPCAGLVVAPGIENMVGQFLNPGDPVAVVARGPFSKVVVVMDQSGIADVQRVRDEPVSVRFRERPGRAFECRVVKVLPQATHEVPPLGLTSAGGGELVLDPGSPRGDRTLLPWFRVELELPEEADVKLGVTGTARFRIAREPLVVQWYYKLLRVLRTKFFL